MKISSRIKDGQDLGRAHRLGDIGLGCAAIVPIIMAALALCFSDLNPRLIRAAITVWSGALLTFFAGVRRGLSFSERGGGRPLELLSMLWIFVLGVSAALLQSTLAAMLGLASVGVLDWMSAIKQEAPRYFRNFRVVQMAVALTALLAVFAKVG